MFDFLFFFLFSGTLEGVKQQRPAFDKLLEDPLLRFSGLYSVTEKDCAPLLIQLQVFDENGKELCLPCSTSYKPFTKRWSWNEWITLPLLYSDLPKTALLALTIYDCAGPGKRTVVGGTTISFFSKDTVFRQGLYDLRVWPNTPADGNVPSKTPGKCKEYSSNSVATDKNHHQMQRLAKLAKMHRNGQISKVDWLDRLTFREIELINQREKEESDYLYLMVEFPSAKFDDKTVSTYKCLILLFSPRVEKSIETQMSVL